MADTRTLLTSQTDIPLCYFKLHATTKLLASKAKEKFTPQGCVPLVFTSSVLLLEIPAAQLKQSGNDVCPKSRRLGTVLLETGLPLWETYRMGFIDPHKGYKQRFTSHRCTLKCQ